MFYLNSVSLPTRHRSLSHCSLLDRVMMAANACVSTPFLLFLVCLVLAVLCPYCDAVTKPMQPLADPAAVTVVGNARFTVLTSHIIRMEWSASKQWQDSATWAINYRLQSVPAFKLSQNWRRKELKVRLVDRE